MIEAHLTKSTARRKLQGCAGKAWVPKLALWEALAGKSDNIRFAVAMKIAEGYRIGSFWTL